jgi:hypothetical protein
VEGESGIKIQRIGGVGGEIIGYRNKTQPGKIIEFSWGHEDDDSNDSLENIAMVHSSRELTKNA